VGPAKHGDITENILTSFLFFKKIKKKER